MSGDIWLERTLRQCVETEMTEAKARIAEQETALAALRAENAHLKRALALADALRNKERNLPL